MRLSKRIENLPSYLFVGISKKIAEKRAKGQEIISFGIGDPDIPTPKHIIDELCYVAQDPQSHRYPESEGLPEFRRAVAEWYRKRFNIILDSDKEVVSLIGAKEGIAHIALCLIDPGDVALVPDPGYPVYGIGTQLSGGQVYYLPINEQNHFFPDLENIPPEIISKSKVLWLNYPNNPTGAVADISLFEKAVDFARNNNLVICHDGPYTEVAYDGYQPVSFLQIKGAKDVGIEFHSLSKSYNMTGWRVGMAVGNSKIIEALRRLKSNLDSGVPIAIQKMATTALMGPQSVILEHNRIYQWRRDKLIPVLEKIGIQPYIPQASLYIWAKCPPGYSSTDLAEDLLEQVGVVVTPGIGYGPHGEGFVRLSLTISDSDLEKGISRLSGWRNKYL